MRLIVLDTNCLLQVLPAHSPYHRIWESVRNGEISLCVNTEILLEYEEILSSKTSMEIARNIVEAIARFSSTVFQDAYIHFGLIQDDVDDNKFVDCAIASGAEFIVTNDAHFDILKTIPWPKVSIVKIEDFVKELR